MFRRSEGCVLKFSKLIVLSASDIVKKVLNFVSFLKCLSFSVLISLISAADYSYNAFAYCRIFSRESITIIVFQND